MDTVDITVFKKNETFIQILCDKKVARELYEHFAFEVPGAKYAPKYRAGIWDGTIRLFKGHDQSLYCGLLSNLIKFAEDNSYSIQYDKTLFSHPYNLSISAVDEFVNELNIHSDGVRIFPFDHQKSAIYSCLIDEPKTTIISPTASGKSLIIYVLSRFFTSVDIKLLIVVPNISLVNQMFSDFNDYSSEIEWDATKNCHLIVGGKEKNSDKSIIISTWQSLYKQPKKYFEQYGAVISDEVHTAKAAALKGILEKCINAKYRYGFTGTLNEAKTDALVIQGLFGKINKIVSTTELIDRKLISPIEIKAIFLEYNNQSRKQCSRMSYQEEIEFVALSKAKLMFTKALAEKIEGNTLILVNFVEKHAIPLYELLSKKSKDVVLQSKKKPIYFIHGGVDGDKREEIRNILEIETNAILVATYGTFAVGVNVKNLSNIIFGASYKSKIRVLQSIGRGLRKIEGKDKMVLYDLIDNLTYTTSKGTEYKNYLLKHFKNRHQFYKNEKFPIIVYQKQIEK